ncbi:spore germination protein [Paenibacillus sp. BC26]|uniref:spore germination protein n=1 Tax=Paenibacillus sp. BC26 TaxID=1881032 RepID=UPI0008EB4094|nr:spore germination protein [Paenibacillus sp. BC26]SFS57824.1 GerA spore germination protein [Paenibacillus sp. BC26]
MEFLVKDAAKNTEPELLSRTLQALNHCADLVHQKFPLHAIDLVYFAHLTGKEQLRKDVIEPFGAADNHQAQIEEQLTQSQYVQATSSEQLTQGILGGQVAIYYSGQAYLYDSYSPDTRSITSSETETVISGPQDSFTESLSTNLSLIRRRLQDPRLKSLSFKLGSESGSTMSLLYMDGVADPDDLQLMCEKLQGIHTHTVLDTNTLTQYLDPRPFTVFPQFLTTVRPDVAVSKLAKGNLVGLLDGSQIAFSAPATFYEFFSSPDDYYMSWLVSSAIRLLRYIALFITLGFTAFYVTVVTYHYEMIPPSLLNNLMESRNKVPFTPLMEAIIMEFTIELLREAGARLPTKVGTTIGTVGGIVIGQAAVQAGITSNILIISVSISAIASFVIPSYSMSSAIRLFRFAIIVLAGLLGNFGLVIGLALFVIQLSGKNAFGGAGAYMSPGNWLDMIVRAPVQWIDKARKHAKSSSR